MANIQPEIKKIQTATYGEEVRNSFISALEKINSSTGNIVYKIETNAEKCLDEAYIYKMLASREIPCNYIIAPIDCGDTVCQFRFGAYFDSTLNKVIDITAYRIYNKITFTFSTWESISSSGSIDDIQRFVDEYLDSHPQDLTLAELKGNKRDTIYDYNSVIPEDYLKYPSIAAIKNQYKDIKIVNIGYLENEDTDLASIINNDADDNVIYYIPPGRHITDPILINERNNITIIAYGATIILKEIISIDNDIRDDIVKAVSCSRIHLAGGCYDGGCCSEVPVDSVSGIAFNDCSDSIISNVEVQNVGTMNTALAVGIILSGNCSNISLNECCVHDIQGGLINTDGYMFSSGIKCQSLESDSIIRTPKNINIFNPKIYNIGFFNGDAYIEIRDVDDSVTGGRTDGDGIFITSASYDYSNINIYGANITKCSKRAFKIRACGVKISNAYVDLDDSSYNTCIEFLLGDGNILENSYIKTLAEPSKAGATLSAIAIDGFNGNILIQNVTIDCGNSGIKNSKRNGIILWHPANSESNRTSENIELSNIYIKNVYHPITSGNDGQLKTNTENIKIKDIYVRGFYSDSIIYIDSQRFRFLKNLEISNLNILPLDGSESSENYTSGLYNDQTFAYPVSFSNKMDVSKSIKISHPEIVDESNTFYNYYITRNFTAKYKSYTNAPMPIEQYTENVNLLSLVDGEYLIADGNDAHITVSDGTIRIPVNNGINATTYIFIPFARDIDISSSQMYKFQFATENGATYVKSGLQLSIAYRPNSGPTRETSASRGAANANTRTVYVKGAAFINNNMQKANYLRIAVPDNMVSSGFPSDYVSISEIEFSTATLELIGYNDIMRRIEILEEQILTLSGGNNG